MTPPAPDAASHSAPRRVWLRDDRYAWPLTLLVWTLVVLMIVPDGFDYRNLSVASAPTSGGALSRLLWLALLGGSTLVLAWRATLAWLLLRWLNPFLLAFCALAVASVAWSIDPTVTVRRLIRLATIVLVAAAFTLTAWRPRRFQELARPILTIMLFGSIVFGLVCPTLGIHQEDSAELVGAWRGLTNHKNTLGALASIGTILWFHAWLAREARTPVAVAGGAIAITCLLLSRSSTSLVSTVFVTLMLLMLLKSPPNLRRYMPYLVGLFVAALLSYALAILRLLPGLDALLTPITLITGKDLSFTGRSEIWEIVSDHIRFHPLLGSGFGAYWTGIDPLAPSYEFVRRMHFYPGSAHNGYLEIVNDLGAAGGVCLIGYLVGFVLQSLRLLAVDRAQGALFLALFFQQSLSNLSETHWLNVMNMDFVIVTLATFATARAGLEHRLRAYFGAPGTAPAAVTPLPARSAA